GRTPSRRNWRRRSAKSNQESVANGRLSVGRSPPITRRLTNGPREKTRKVSVWRPPWRLDGARLDRQAARKNRQIAGRMVAPGANRGSGRREGAPRMAEERTQVRHELGVVACRAGRGQRGRRRRPGSLPASRTGHGGGHVCRVQGGLASAVRAPL